MCIAIVKTADGKITDKQLKNCFENNPDGAGVAYAKDGQLYYVKGIFDVNEFIKQVREAEKVAEGSMLIHCRISTSGKIDKDNCHPHVVNSHVVMIHNGILDIDVPKGSTKSDTVLFVEQYLQPLSEDFMKDKNVLTLLEHIIGSTNKFCFLNNKGEFAIVNEKAGDWEDGVWYSNTSHRYATYTKWWNYGKSKTSTTSASPYSCYDDYGYDEEDEFYWETYGMTKQEFLEEYGLTSSEKLKIKQIIRGLTDEQLQEFGEAPVYDLTTGVLKGEHEYTSYGDMFLYELDDELQYLYEARYFNYFDEEEFDEVFADEFEFTEVDNDLADKEDEDLDKYEDDEDYYDGWQFLRRHADEFDELNETTEATEVADDNEGFVSKTTKLIKKIAFNG